jgi:hypothetical protein
MKQIFINEFEKAGNDDINQLQLAIYQGLQDDFIYRFFGAVGAGVLGSDLAVSYVSALVASIAPGVGFVYDGSQTLNSPKFRIIKAASAVSVAFAAADPTNNRIDKVCLIPNFAVTQTASRFVKTGGTGPIVQQTVNKILEMTYTLQVVTGTPAASPTVPATSSGALALATVLIRAGAGMSGAIDVTDIRFTLTPPANGTSHNILTSTTIQGQLDNADTALSKQLLVQLNGSWTGLNLTLANHGGRQIMVDSTGLGGFGRLMLPALSSSSGFKCWITDINGNFSVKAPALHPNGTDKIMGINQDYNLETPWKTWLLVGDSANGWYVK